MVEISEKRVERLKGDLMDGGMSETEAYHRARAFLKKAKRE